MTYFVWGIRGLFMLDILLLLSLPVAALLIKTDLAGEGMAMAYTAFALLVGGVLLGGLALAWRAVRSTWATLTVGGLVAGFTFALATLLYG
jgi:hypothetical protein